MVDETKKATGGARLAMNGRAWIFGDNVPTDEMVPTRWVFSPMTEIVKHLLEELKPGFPANVAPGDVIVAGHHFGQSSGRAVAPKAIQAAGVSCIIAESFARTFLRNCYEIGLPIIECAGASTLATDGDIVSFDLVTGKIVNETRGKTLNGRPVDEFLLNMLRAGGLIALVRERGTEWGIVKS